MRIGAVFAALLLYTSLELDLSRLYQGGDFMGQYGWLYVVMFLSFGVFAACISRKSSAREQRFMTGKLSTRTKATILLSLFLWFLSEPMLEKLDRVKVKYGLIEK